MDNYLGKTCSTCVDCDQELVHEMAAKRVVSVWIDSGTMHGISQADTRRLILQGLEEFAMVCGITFEVVDKKAGARIRIEFDPYLDALGRAWSGGQVKFNSSRVVNNLLNRRVVQALTCHEIGHVLGLHHGGERNDIMHPHLGYHWSVDEVRTLQRKHGKPDEPWHPTDRIEKGQQLRSAIAQFDMANEAWKIRVEQRNKFAAAGLWDEVRRVQPDVLKRLKLRDERGATVAKLHKEWWVINRKWNTSGVAGVVKL